MRELRIGIVGLGLMGSKLVEYFASKGIRVVAYNWRNIESKKKEVELNLRRTDKAGAPVYPDAADIAAKVSFTEDLEALKGCGIVMDCSPEKYEIKEKVYSGLRSAMRSDAALATLTSSLSLLKLAAMFFPERLVGLHFFNPPTKMKLVELAFLPETDEAVRKGITEFVNSLQDKKVIEIPPIQGYIVNRLLFAYINYAIEYARDTKIDIKEIDSAMRFGVNFPMGPFELCDYIGNDIVLEILNELYTSLGDARYKPAPGLAELVEAGKLGRKVKQGFYPY